ncbi:DUF1573 domain-containing protein [Candidatus Sumerlaeota bacterium]|nr:DUF1573 domain-containing protein [Candidatus Sumerlaeota bacterium]
MRKSPPHCGIAAVNSILKYISIYPDQIDLVPDDYCSSSTALSLLDLKNILKEKGFDSSGYLVSIQELDKKFLPAIAHLENHFIAILDSTDTHLLISDMKRYPFIINRGTFSSYRFTGNILSVNMGSHRYSDNKAEVRILPGKNNPFSSVKINLGNIQSKDPIKIQWRINNETNRYLSSSSIDSTCNCIEISPKEISLEKNKSQILTTTFLPPHETSFSENTVYVFWNEKNIEPLELTITSFHIRKFRFIDRFVGFLNGFCGAQMYKEISFMNEGFDVNDIDFTTTGPISIKDIYLYDPDSSFTSGVITLSVNLPDKPEGFTYYLAATDKEINGFIDTAIFSGESKSVFQLKPEFLYWNPENDKFKIKSCFLTPLGEEQIRTIKIKKNELDYHTKIMKTDNNKWEIQSSPIPGGKRLTGKLEIWINDLSYPLYLRLIAKN